MTTLGDKLSRLGIGASRAPKPADPPASGLDGRLARELARLRVAVAEVEARRTRLVSECDPSWTLPEGETLETPHGPAWRLRRRYEPGHVHGRVPLAAAWDARGRFAALATADARLADFSAREALYIDTETTGLAGGTGTIAFQIGA
ncbi:MAG: hypothetical protein KC466_03975, partial [Myxococcales bacterium]|nr:hypothetical protein [Myxococcales bacterium]